MANDPNVMLSRRSAGRSAALRTCSSVTFCSGAPASEGICSITAAQPPCSLSNGNDDSGDDDSGAPVTLNEDSGNDDSGNEDSGDACRFSDDSGNEDRGNDDKGADSGGLAPSPTTPVSFSMGMSINGTSTTPGSETLVLTLRTALSIEPGMAAPSKAPMSQRNPSGRVTPRWSRSSQLASLKNSKFRIRCSPPMPVPLAAAPVNPAYTLPSPSASVSARISTVKLTVACVGLEPVLEARTSSRSEAAS